MSLLHRASRGGRATVAEALLQAGADVNFQGRRGRSPLHEASRAGSARIVSLLVSHGANVNAEDTRGRTSLHYATNYEVGRMLLGAGANPDVKDNNGEKPHVTAGARKGCSGNFESFAERRRLRNDTHRAQRHSRRSASADWDSRERDLERSVARRLKESLRGGERLARWLEDRIGKQHGAISYLEGHISERRHNERRRHQWHSETSATQNTLKESHPSSSSSKSCHGRDSDHTSLKNPPRGNCRRGAPARAKETRHYVGHNRVSDEKGGRDNFHRRKSIKCSWTNGGGNYAKGTRHECINSSSDEQIRSLEEEGWLGCAHVTSGTSGTDRSARYTEDDIHVGVQADQGDNVGVCYSRGCSSRPPGRCPGRPDNNTSPQNRQGQPILSDEEAEWIIAHRLVRSISAVIAMSGSGSPGGRGRRESVETAVSTSTKQPTPLQEHGRSNAAQRRKQRENKQLRVGAAGSGPSKLNHVNLSERRAGTDEVGQSQHEERPANWGAGTTSGTGPSSGLVHDHSDSHVKRASHGALNRTPRERSRAGTAERCKDCACAVVLGGGGDRRFANAKILLAEQLLSFMSAAIGTAAPRSPGSRASQEKTPRGAVQLAATNGRYAAPTTDTPTTLPEDGYQKTANGNIGDEGPGGKGSDGKEIVENNDGIASHAGIGCPKQKGGAVVVSENSSAERADLGAVTIPVGSSETSLTVSQHPEPEERFRIAEASYTDPDRSGAADPVKWACPKKSVADQVLEVADRLSRICVLPVS